MSVCVQYNHLRTEYYPHRYPSVLKLPVSSFDRTPRQIEWRIALMQVQLCALALKRKAFYSFILLSLLPSDDGAAAGHSSDCFRLFDLLIASASTSTTSTTTEEIASLGR